MRLDFHTETPSARPRIRFKPLKLKRRYLYIVVLSVLAVLIWWYVVSVVMSSGGYMYVPS